MKQRATRLKQWAVCLVLVAFVCVALAPLTALAIIDDAPTAVLNSRAGVFRIVVLGDDWGAVGTGFAVGTQDEYYIITNHHVIEDAEEIQVYYNTGEYVLADVLHDDPGRDLCVLALRKSIPEVQILPVQTAGIDSGIAVFALGFPAVADEVAGDWDLFWSGEMDFVADKQSMTVTAGNISAIRDSRYVGNETRTVRTLQTDARISGGNSGGPLLDKLGNVVGINTQISTLAPKIGICVHAEELVAVLNAADILFYEAADKAPTEPPSLPSATSWVPYVPSVYQPPAARYSSREIQNLTIGLSAALFVFILLIIVIVTRIRANSSRGSHAGRLTLTQFEKGNTKIEEFAICEMTKAFLHELIPLSMAGDLAPLLTPDNILIIENKISLKSKDCKRYASQGVLHSGYSAPECHYNQRTAASDVYFVGAVMYTLLTGHRPADAPSRAAGNCVLPGNRIMANIVNKAMDPMPRQRIPDISVLLQVLTRMSERIAREDRTG